MRVQHNITAMNSYRNYNNNTSTINKNIEKLSSGYKINRAGDDAAGLAISEKMRAQITGLDMAQRNAKDGISLVQTAEGALTEVHSMLNRMAKLAEQSANGTYDSNLDRDQLQKEVDQLRTEINRIADSSNFNGIKLLNGELDGVHGGSPKADMAMTAASVKGLSAGTTVAQVSGTELGMLQDSGGTNTPLGDLVGDFANIASASSDATLTATVELSDGTKFNYEFKVDTAGAVTLDGTALTATLDTSGGETGANLAAALAEALSKETSLSDKYTFAANNTALEMTSTEGRFGDLSIKVASFNLNVDGAVKDANVSGNVTTAGKGEFKNLDISQLQVYDASSTTKNANQAIFTVNGKKFAFAKDEASAKELGSDVNVVITSSATPGATDVPNMVTLMNQKLKANVEAPASGTTIELITKGGYDDGGGTGLRLQIGDTAEEWNQLNVSIKDVHADAIGIGTIDISNQQDAATAMDSIKSAINYVSDVRGTLGATQNRLEHTINNLSVMQENIQDAESTIRDTDVADEMMKYTKNSILVQSAQAMLAQANQQPQGVLQLLQ